MKIYKLLVLTPKVRRELYEACELSRYEKYCVLTIPTNIRKDVGVGRIKIGQKCRRGVAGDRNTCSPGYKNILVTSASNNKINGELASTFSPLRLGPVYRDGKVVAQKFENYWQFGKMWPTAGHIKDGLPTDKWFAFREKGYKMDKGKRRLIPVRQYGFPTSSYYDGKVYGYVESRIEYYIPIYAELIENLPVMNELRKLLESGQDIMIIDGDGAPKSLYPEGMDVTYENWMKMRDDPRFPFGHGYVIAGMLAGFI